MIFDNTFLFLFFLKSVQNLGTVLISPQDILTLTYFWNALTAKLTDAVVMKEADAHWHVERGAALKFPNEMISRLAHSCRDTNILQGGHSEDDRTKRYNNNDKNVAYTN
jgi:hypothetical protein